MTLGTQTHPFQRGILDATLQVTPDYQLRLIGIHLKSRREVEEGDQAVMRRHEAVLLREHVEAILEAAPHTNLLRLRRFQRHEERAAGQGDPGAVRREAITSATCGCRTRMGIGSRTTGTSPTATTALISPSSTTASGRRWRRKNPLSPKTPTGCKAQ